MAMLEFTLTSRLREQLRSAFAPYLERKVGPKQIPLGQWLIRGGDGQKSLPADLSIQLAITLDNILAAESGAEGQELHQAIEQLKNGSGVPALVLHGLPFDGDAYGIGTIINEAFRQQMLPDRKLQRKHNIVAALRDDASLEGYRMEKRPLLHHDHGDIVLLTGLRGGGNPRHTNVYTVDALLDLLVDGEGFKPTAPEQRDALRKQFLELMQQPIWPIWKSWLAAYRDAKQQSWVVENHEGRKFAPLIIPNPAYDVSIRGSCEYKFIGVPFANNQDRIPLDIATLYSVPAKEHSLANDLLMRLGTITGMYADATGPVLQEGDMLMINNRLVMHTGGEFVHELLPPERKGMKPRAITVADLSLQREKTPSWQEREAIVMDDGVAR